MLVSRAGLLWIIDFEDLATLHISTTHASERIVNALIFVRNEVKIDDKDHENETNEQSTELLCTAGQDFTLKIWDLKFNV